MPAVQAMAIEIVGLRKSYTSNGRLVEALSGIELSVPKGMVYGLLGPNGAGKTTLLRILTGLIRYDQGQVDLFGTPLSDKSPVRVGASIESPNFPPYLSGYEVLQWLSHLYPGQTTSINMLLERVGLMADAHRQVAGYSLGMKQRLSIAAALIGNPDLVILDEPVNGLDPSGIQDVRKIVRELSEQEGRTILLSSHLLDEVERTCDRIAILNQGRIVAEDETSRFQNKSSKLLIEAEPVEPVLAWLGNRGELNGTTITAQIARDDVPTLLKAMVAANVRIFELRRNDEKLETLYFAEVERI
jgi:ABC-2 type transport system ATP-binding protein